jgi:hypothetical protein
LKRIRYHAKGRSGHVQRRYSRITIILRQVEQDPMLNVQEAKKIRPLRKMTPGWVRQFAKRRAKNLSTKRPPTTNQISVDSKETATTATAK